MRLAGRLQATTLGDVLGSLHRLKASGVLELTETAGATAGRKHQIHLAGGQILAVESASGDGPLGEILRRRGLLDAAAHRRLTFELARGGSGKLTGELLVGQRLATSDAVGAALRHQLRARLDALFRLPDAMLSFHVARGKAPAQIAAPLPADDFLRGRPRRRDRQAAPRQTERHAPAAGATPPAAGPSRARVEALRALGLPAEADRDEVVQAFRTLARNLHPDRFPGASEVERRAQVARFAAISAAYHALVG